MLISWPTWYFVSHLAYVLLVFRVLFGLCSSGSTGAASGSPPWAIPYSPNSSDSSLPGPPMGHFAWPSMGHFTWPSMGHVSWPFRGHLHGLFRWLLLWASFPGPSLPLEPSLPPARGLIHLPSGNSVLIPQSNYFPEYFLLSFFKLSILQGNSI